MSISRRKRRFLSGASFNAEVAELADAHGSGPCTRKGVGVRVPSSAPNLILLLVWQSISAALSSNYDFLL
jgi:hypothetical protein